MFVPLPAYSMQNATAVAQCLGESPVEMPRLGNTMKLAVHLPYFPVGSAVTVAKARYVRLRHGSQIRLSSRAPLCLLGRSVSASGNIQSNLFQICLNAQIAKCADGNSALCDLNTKCLD